MKLTLRKERGLGLILMTSNALPVTRTKKLIKSKKLPNKWLRTTKVGFRKDIEPTQT